MCTLVLALVLAINVVCDLRSGFMLMVDNVNTRVQILCYVYYNMVYINIAHMFSGCFIWIMCC